MSYFESLFLARRVCYSSGWEWLQGSRTIKMETRTWSEMWNGLGRWLRKSSSSTWPVESVGTAPQRPRLDIRCLRTEPAPSQFWFLRSWLFGFFLELPFATAQMDLLDTFCSALLKSHHPPLFFGLVSSLTCLGCLEYEGTLPPFWGLVYPAWRLPSVCLVPWCPTFWVTMLLQGVSTLSREPFSITVKSFAHILWSWMGCSAEDRGVSQRIGVWWGRRLEKGCRSSIERSLPN